MTIIVDDSGHPVLPGVLPGVAIGPASVPPTSFWATMAAVPPVVAPPVVSDPDADVRFVLPDLYYFYPQVIRNEDVYLVPRGDVPVYFWDTVLTWDTEPYSWDQLIGPEPILHTTTRCQQIEWERSALEINRLTRLIDIFEVPAAYLVYIAAQLGTVLPGTNVSEQRLFLFNLVKFYKGKGTPLTFVRMFETMGFHVFLTEQYQRVTDANFVPGPQIALVESTYVLDEAAGTTIASPGPYRLRLASNPVMRGSIKVTVYDQDANAPRVFIDNNGSWSGNVTGTIDYETGAGFFVLPDTPTLVGQPITVTYRYLADPFPDPYGSRWVDRVRSSYVAAAFQAIDDTVVVTEELAERLEAMLELLRPAHVLFDDVSLRSAWIEDAAPTEEMNIFGILFYEPVFEVPYRGYGYDVTENMSTIPDQPFAGRHRDEEEWIITYEQDALPTPQAPYVYPWSRTGTFYNPLDVTSPTKDYLGYSPYDSYESAVTADLVASTTIFSITDVGTLPATIGSGNCKLVFKTASAKLSGEWSGVVTIVDSGAYFTVTVSPALPLVPETGDEVILLPNRAVRRDCLDVRPIDALDIYYVEDAYPGNGIATTFTGFYIASQPCLPNAVLLRFTVAGTTYEESDDGVGGFSNNSGLVVGGGTSIDYTGPGAPPAGEFKFQSTIAPDGATNVQVLYGTAGTTGLGDF